MEQAQEAQESQQAQEPVKVEGTLIHKTANAILWEVEGTGIWFPLSTVKEEAKDFLLVEHWIAQKKGIA